LEDAGGLAELAPEALGDLRDSVNSDTVEVVVSNEVTDPLLERRSDVVVILVQVGQVGQTAVLNVLLVVPVGNLAVVVVVV